MKTTEKNPHAVALGHLGGRAGTERQNAARRENGKRGGRPAVYHDPDQQVAPTQDLRPGGIRQIR